MNLEFIQEYGKELVALAVPFIAWLLNNIFRAKANLLVSTPHQFTFTVEEPVRDTDGAEISSTQNVATRSHLVSNGGTVTASNVELTFNWKPMYINIWPPRHFQNRLELDGRCTLTFVSLAPEEYFDCELLSVGEELPRLVTARCDQCVAKDIVMYPQPHVATWKKRVAATLVFAGAVLSIYLIVVLLQLLVLKTPSGI